MLRIKPNQKFIISLSIDIHYQLFGEWLTQIKMTKGMFLWK